MNKLDLEKISEECKLLNKELIQLNRQPRSSDILADQFHNELTKITEMVSSLNEIDLLAKIKCESSDLKLNEIKRFKINDNTDLSKHKNGSFYVSSVAPIIYTGKLNFILLFFRRFKELHFS